MAKRKTPTSDPGEIRNPVKAAALISAGHVPVEVTRKPTGVACFFQPTKAFLGDSLAYDARMLYGNIAQYNIVRRRLLDLKEYGDIPRLPELADTVFS